MAEIVFGPPVTAVNIQQDGVRSFRAGNPHIEKLIRIRPIGDAIVRRRLRPAQNVFSGHR
jgi:hypothetical protein